MVVMVLVPLLTLAFPPLVPVELPFSWKPPPAVIVYIRVCPGVTGMLLDTLKPPPPPPRYPAPVPPIAPAPHAVIVTNDAPAGTVSVAFATAVLYVCVTDPLIVMLPLPSWFTPAGSLAMTYVPVTL